jgi:NAD(P)H-dependent flavin oxidoreductase YrpB (nitropropane dioxygenase family)
MKIAKILFTILIRKFKYDAYDRKKYRHDYFDKKTGGYLVVEKERITQGLRNKQEENKFNKERAMCITLACNGYAVEYLKDTPKSYDIHLNGIKADLKKTASHNNMLDYAKKAIYKQGAEMVVFEFENNSKKIQEELDKLKRNSIRVCYYYSYDKTNIHKL